MNLQDIPQSARHRPGAMSQSHARNRQASFFGMLIVACDAMAEEACRGRIPANGLHEIREWAAQGMLECAHQASGSIDARAASCTG